MSIAECATMDSRSPLLRWHPRKRHRNGSVRAGIVLYTGTWHQQAYRTVLFSAPGDVADAICYSPVSSVSSSLSVSICHDMSRPPRAETASACNLSSHSTSDRAAFFAGFDSNAKRMWIVDVVLRVRCPAFPGRAFSGTAFLAPSAPCLSRNAFWVGRRGGDTLLFCWFINLLLLLLLLKLLLLLLLLLLFFFFYCCYYYYHHHHHHYYYY